MNRSKLNADYLYSLARNCFEKVPEHRKNTGNIKISISDALMSALAMFSLKESSLLSLEKVLRADTMEGKNIRNLFGIKQPASDTQMRDIIDPVNPENLRTPFRKIFANIQRSGVLAEYRYLDEGYLISLDGTGHYSSSKVRCDDCIEEKTLKWGQNIQSPIVGRGSNPSGEGDGDTLVSGTNIKP